MAFPSTGIHELYIYNHNDELVGILRQEALKTLSYETEVNAVAPCAFSLQEDHELAQLLDIDFLIQVRRYDTKLQSSYVENNYLVAAREHFKEDSGTTFVLFGGVSLEDLLARRIIDIRDDPLAANGFSTKGGAAETVMHSYVHEQLGVGASLARRIGLVMGSNNALGATVGRRETYSATLLEVLQSIANQSGIDFAITYNAGTLTFVTGRWGSDLRKSNDPTNALVFSEKQLNMQDPRIRIDYKSSKNYCYAFGAGQGEDRELYEQSNAYAIETRFSRREFKVDSSNSEPGSSLQVLGDAQDALKKEEPVYELSFEMTANCAYRQRWVLGDKATGVHGGKENNYRITKVAVSISGNRETIAPTLTRIVGT